METKLLDQFQLHNVGCVFNLTEPGEHPYCGTGILDATGFPYSPEKLMARGVRHFNYAWPDMTCPAVSLVLDIVQVACHQLNDGLKIAVHCHAGFGRTGIVCACILIAKYKLSADEAIELVRKQRPGSIQTALQVNFVRHTFSSTWNSLLTVFPVTTIAAAPLKSIKQSIRDQQQLLNTEDLSRRTFRWLPKVFSSLTLFAASSLQTLEAQCILYTAITGLVLAGPFTDVEWTPVEDSTHHDILISGDFLLLLTNVKDELNRDSWGALDSLARRNCINSSSFPNLIGVDAATTKEQEQHVSHVGEAGALASLPAYNPINVAVAVQLALDWMDTRSDCVVDADCLSHLSALLSTSTSAENSASPATANLLASHVREIVTRQLCKSRLAILKTLVELIECLEGNAAAQFFAAARIALSCLQLTPDLITSSRRTSPDFLVSCRMQFSHGETEFSSPIDPRIRPVVIVVRLLTTKALFSLVEPLSLSPD